MSAESTPSTGYTLHVGLNDVRTYDCDFCGHHSTDIDGARAHRQEHVAGPDLLTALKKVIGLSDRKHDAWDEARVAIAKAEQRP